MINEFQNIVGYSLITVVYICIFWVMPIYIFRNCTLSLLGKPLNRPPSQRKWLRAEAEVIFESEKTITLNEAVSIDAREVRLKYTIDGNTCYSDVCGFNQYSKYVVIYVNRKNPQIVKEYIANKPWSKDACIGILFIALFAEICHAVIITEILVPFLSGYF